VDEDFHDQNLIMSLGGDGTFLKTASMVQTSRVPVLGVNTDPTRSVGHLCSRKIPFDTRKTETERMLKYLDRENFEMKYR
jgi:NAD kinase